jgi:hypothetical protein
MCYQNVNGRSPDDHQSNRHRGCMHRVDLNSRHWNANLSPIFSLLKGHSNRKAQTSTCMRRLNVFGSAEAKTVIRHSNFAKASILHVLLPLKTRNKILTYIVVNTAVTQIDSNAFTSIKACDNKEFLFGNAEFGFGHCEVSYGVQIGRDRPWRRSWLLFATYIYADKKSSQNARLISTDPISAVFIWSISPQILTTFLCR